MTKGIIDERVKAYLVACLVAGIDVSCDQHEMMTGIVNHLNQTERMYWAQGDEDGVIVHDKHDIPVLYVMYDGTKLSFRAFEQDEFLERGANKNLGLAVLNIIGYLQDNAFDFGPSILGSEAHVVSHIQEQETDNTEPEDWAL